MPSFSDFTQFLGGQAFGTTILPEADLSGKTIIITGGNSGLGLDCSKHLTAILSNAKNENTLSVEIWPLDLEDFTSVIAFIQRVQSEPGRVDAFIANAGVEPQAFSLSEGIERTLTVNVISTYLSILGVLPKLRETSRALGQHTTLNVVGSMAHLLADDSELDIAPDLEIFSALSDPKTAKMGSRYPLSKLMSILLFLELAEREEGGVANEQYQIGKVVINTCNPGWCDTGLHRYKSPPIFERLAFSILGRASEQGSRSLVHAVCAGAETHGKYLSECAVKPTSSFVRSGKGTQMRGRLWIETIQRLGTIWPEVVDGIEL